MTPTYSGVVKVTLELSELLVSVPPKTAVYPWYTTPINDSFIRPLRYTKGEIRSVAKGTKKFGIEYKVEVCTYLGPTTEKLINNENVAKYTRTK